jgi:hypothetical protein
MARSPTECVPDRAKTLGHLLPGRDRRPQAELARPARPYGDGTEIVDEVDRRRQNDGGVATTWSRVLSGEHRANLLSV